MPPTLSDIAQEAGFSLSTVADVLRGRAGYSAETRKRIMETAERLDFVPNYFAQSLQKQRSHTIGVAGSLEHTGVTGDMLKAISTGLQKKGYLPFFCDSSEQPCGAKRAVSALRARLVDGIILNDCIEDTHLKRLLPKSLPCVMIRYSDDSAFPSVISDRFEALGCGVRWLAERGHRRIAFIGSENPRALQNPANTQCLKIRGYSAAMKELGLYDESLLVNCPTTPGQPREFAMRNAPLLRGMTAILAGNDRTAVELITALSEMGVRVPEDCSVIGFDDTEYAIAVRPRLTTFQPRREEVGAKAVEMILDLIEGRPVENATIVPELIERESAGPFRKEEIRVASVASPGNP